MPIQTTWRVEQDNRPARMLEEVWRTCNRARTVQDACLWAESYSRENTAYAYSVIATIRHASRPTTDDYEVTYTYRLGHLIATTRVNLGVPDVVLPGQLDIYGNVYQPEPAPASTVPATPIQASLF